MEKIRGINPCNMDPGGFSTFGIFFAGATVGLCDGCVMLLSALDDWRAL